MAKIQKKSKQQFHLIPFFYFPPKDYPAGGAAIPTRLCRLPEQELHQPSKRAPTLQFSHRLHRTHSGWRRISSHRLHGYAQIRRVWHPCHTHAATKLSSHRIHGTHRNDWRRRKNLCTSVKSVGEYPPPEISVNSVNSVGEYPPPEASVNSVQSVGGLAQTNLEWVLWKEFGGRRGYGRNAIPSYESSHGLHGCAQIRRQNAT